MASVLEEKFISNFHSLEGITIGERRKNLFNLLYKTRCDAEHSEINFSSLHPKTPLEENFKVEALIYFKRIPELLEVLKSENRVLIEKILKINSWFINEAFKNINGEQLVTQIFPHLSYNTKLKLLNKFALHLNDTKRADEYFEAIKDKYGLYLASKFIVACSSDLIMKYIESYRIEITPKHLLSIIKRHSSFAESIFDKIKQNNNTLVLEEKYNFVFIYLLKHDIPLFLVLMEKYNPAFKLGARATKTFICAHKQGIIEKPKKFYNLLKQNQIYKTLRQDFKNFYQNLLPKSATQFEELLHDFIVLLSRIPSDTEKVATFFTATRTVYGEELCYDPIIIVPKIIEMMSVDQREAWMKTHQRPKHVSENTWISYMKTEKSIPLLKEKFSHSADMTQRADLICCLVKTCKVNKDTKALTDILQFALQHRNDHVSVQQEFLKILFESFNMMKLTSEQWSILKEYLCFYQLNHDYYWACNEILEKYIYYCFEKNLPVREVLTDCAKATYSYYCVCKNKREYERSSLLMFSEIIPSVYKGEELTENYLQYLECLISYNKRHPRDKISLFINTEAINSLKKLLKDETYTFVENRIAVECILSDYEKSVEADLINVLLCKEERRCKKKLVQWLARNHPSVLSNHIESIAENCLSLHNLSLFSNHFWYKYYTHLGISQRFSEICIQAVNTEENEMKKRKCAVAILSYMMNSHDFLKFVESHSVSELTPDITSNEGQNKYQLHQSMLPSLKNVNPASLALDCILSFCKGDYLKYVLVSLYSILHNVAENKLCQFLNQLKKSAVSVRKHSIPLAFKLLNRTQAQNFVEDVKKNDKNSSIQQRLLKTVFNFFIRNPDDFLRDFTKQCMETIDRNDEAAFKMLTCKNIPSQYAVQYLLCMWNILEEFSDPTDVIIEGKTKLLRGTDKNTFSLLPKDFCEELIEKYLFKSHDVSDFDKAVFYFICRCVIYCTNDNDQNEYINLVFTSIRNYVKSTWQNLNTNVVGRKAIFQFVQEFCNDFLAKICLDIKVIQMFVNMWNDFLKPHEAFDEYLYLQFTLMYTDFVKEKATISYVGKKLALLCDELHQKESLVKSIFRESFAMFESYFFSEDSDSDKSENKLIIIESILKTSKSQSCLALAVNLLPLDLLMTSKMKTMYNTIFESLRSNGDSEVHIYLHHYLGQKN